MMNRLRMAYAILTKKSVYAFASDNPLEIYKDGSIDMSSAVGMEINTVRTSNYYCDRDWKGRSDEA